jgi:formylglycine-generating enzyme required for sulfatase activity
MFQRMALAAVLCAAWSFGAPAQAEKRLALVIGNSAYKMAPLANAVGDARLIARRLQGLGFEVLAGHDLSLRDMKRAVRDFAASIRAGGKDSVAFIYYAGHGVQVRGENYLIPIDANIRAEGDVDIDSLRASSIMSMLSHAETSVNIVIFDACRDNPFGYFRSGQRGLARVDAPRGSLVAFSTSPGAKAEDGKDGHSPYAAALAQALGEPGLRIEEVFKKVRIAVLKATGGRQTPWESTSLTGEFYPAGRRSAPVPAAKAPSLQKRSPPASREGGTIFRDCPNCPEMIAIPAGRFLMGSPEDEPGRSRNEGPRHRVTISKPFAAGRFPVTFTEWDDCLAEGGCDGHKPYDQGWGRGDRPVVNVNWRDAQSYVGWLRRKTGKPYRLLSEAEWEYAARAGSSAPFWWGPSISTDQANYNGAFAYDGGKRGKSRFVTVPVKSFQPNPWGLYQVHGNVWEWVQDCVHDSYEGAPADGSAWIGGNCLAHVVRGGSWFDGPAWLRSAQRLGWTLRLGTIGFRVARDLERRER